MPAKVLHFRSVTIGTFTGGRWRTSTDGHSQVTLTAALTVRSATWLRDEETNASESSVGDAPGE